MAKKATADQGGDATLPSSWLDEETNAPVIDQYAQRLETFLETLADGRVDDTELKAQEGRVVQLMREIEPQLPPPLHAKVTELLCELTAYDLMQFIHSVHAARPHRPFRG